MSKLALVTGANKGIGFETARQLAQADVHVIIGARDEEQLKQNLGAVGWSLTADQVARLDAASEQTLPYPYWHQRQFKERNPPPPGFAQ